MTGSAGSTAILSPKILADEILFATFVILAWMSHSATRLAERNEINYTNHKQHIKHEREFFSTSQRDMVYYDGS